jgi:FkbM family methyltransferase
MKILGVNPTKFVRRIMSRILRWRLKQYVSVEFGGTLSRVGSSYGGWLVPLGEIDESSICYSVGIGEDVSFDLGLIERLNCSVFAFDPTPRAVQYVESVISTHQQFTFTPVGIWSESTTLRFYSPEDETHVSHSVTNAQGTDSYFEAECWTILDAMNKFGHSRIDLLKLDIEGAEYSVLYALFQTDIRPRVIAAEFHLTSSLTPFVSIYEQFIAAGYRPIAVEDWNVTFVHSG